MENNCPIFPAKTAIDTFRESGYRNTASAIAELIDNSIEAEADDIQILTFSEYVQVRQRSILQIQQIAVYDNGVGMGPDELAICLQFGNGTKLRSRKGIGRFGIGLPNASVSQCRRVEVYSWRGDECYYTYLDVDQVKAESMDFVHPVILKDLPTKILSGISGEIGDSGTVIVWDKCDKIDLSKAATLFRRMSKELCRIYRHFLDIDDTYGKRRRIRLIAIDSDFEEYELLANDPLYTMTPNNVPDYEDVATNVAHCETIIIPVNYNNQSSKVEIRFSIALPETQSLGGSSPLGQHYKENTGISFVRAAREIDFGSFGFYNEREERERWWGCEIRFEPVLDELFGVTNNKQNIRGIHYIDEKEFRQEHDDWEDLLEDDPKLKLCFELSRRFESNHKQIMDVVRRRGAGKRGGTPVERAKSDKSTEIANRLVADATADTRSANEGKFKSVEEKQEEWKDRLLHADQTLSTEEAEEVAIEKVNLMIEKDFGDWPGSQFFSIEPTGSTCVIVINRKHPFFTDLYETLMEETDSKHILALDLALMAYARMEDELYSRADELDEIRDVWGRHLRAFLLEMRKEA